MPTPAPAETLRKLHALRAEYTRRASRHLEAGELDEFSAYLTATKRIRDAAERVYRKLDADLVAERFALRHSHGRSA